MDYVTQYYKNLSEQLQQRVNVLQNKIQQLNEMQPPGGGGLGGGRVKSPFEPGGYFYPSQLTPNFSPKPSWATGTTPPSTPESTPESTPPTTPPKKPLEPKPRMPYRGDYPKGPAGTEAYNKDKIEWARKSREWKDRTGRG